MRYRILADENVEQATINYLRKLGHDVEWIGDVEELGLGTDDESIATYGRDTDRLILTQDDDFFANWISRILLAFSFRRTRDFRPESWVTSYTNSQST